MSAVDRKRRLLNAAERAPLRVGHGTATRTQILHLMRDGYLRRDRSTGVELWVRTDKPFDDGRGNGGFDFEAHARRYAEW